MSGTVIRAEDLMAIAVGPMLQQGRVAQQCLSGLPDAPATLEVYPTNKCSLRCAWCCEIEFRRRVDAEMDLRMFDLLVEEASAMGVRSMTLTGGGDPTFHPSFNDMVRYAIRHEMKVGLVTSAGIAGVADDVIEALSWVRVSVDQLDPVEYKRWKGTDEQFRQMMDYLDRWPKLSSRVGVSMAVGINDLPDLEDFADAMRQAGVRYMVIKKLDKIEHRFKYEFNEQLMDRIERVAQLHPGWVRVRLEEPDDAVTGNAGLPCRMHAVTCIVSPNGDLHTCCSLAKDRSVFGNLRDGGFKNAWTSAAHRAKATELLDPAFTSARCPECRITKYNMVADQVLGDVANHDQGFI